MTDFLTITKGGTTIIVDVSSDQGPVEREPRRVGETVTTVTGRLSSSVSASFREWDMPAGLMSAAAYEALRALVDNDAFVTIGGTALATAGTFTAVVRVTTGPFLRATNTTDGYKRRASLNIRQV